MSERRGRLRPTPLPLAALTLGTAAPLWAYGRMDPDWYWTHDVDGLLHLRLVLHGLAWLFSLTTLAWIALPRRADGRLDHTLHGLLDGALAYGALTLPIPTFYGVLALLFASRGFPNWQGTASMLLHPLGYLLVLLLWVRTERPPSFRRRALASTLLPLGALALLHLSAAGASRRCYGLIAEGEPDYLERLEAYCPFTPFLNLDPLMMRYLRETGYLVVRDVPETIPPDSELTERIARAWEVLVDGDMPNDARRRYELLRVAKGYPPEGAQRPAPLD